LDGDTWRHSDFYWGSYFNARNPNDPDSQRQARDEALTNYNERCKDV
jgi:hypothetical protein